MQTRTHGDPSDCFSQTTFVLVPPEDVILLTAPPACPQGHDIQSEPLNNLILTFAKAHKLCVQKQLFRYIFFYNRKCITFQASFNRYSKLCRILLLCFIKKNSWEHINVAESLMKVNLENLSSHTHNLGQIKQALDLL